jgi:hypothetical protein
MAVMDRRPRRLSLYTSINEAVDLPHPPKNRISLPDGRQGRRGKKGKQRKTITKSRHHKPQ